MLVIFCQRDADSLPGKKGGIPVEKFLPSDWSVSSLFLVFSWNSKSTVNFVNFYEHLTQFHKFFSVVFQPIFLISTLILAISFFLWTLKLIGCCFLVPQGINSAYCFWDMSTYLFVYWFCVSKCGCTHGMQMRTVNNFQEFHSSPLTFSLQFLTCFFYSLCFHVLTVGFIRGKSGLGSLQSRTLGQYRRF